MNKITCITLEDDQFVSLILKNLIESDERLTLVEQCEDSVSATLALAETKTSSSIFRHHGSWFKRARNT